MTDRRLVASVLRLAALAIAALVSAANEGCSGGTGGAIDPATEPAPTTPSGERDHGRMNGTYFTANAGACTGDRGTLTAHR